MRDGEVVAAIVAGDPEGLAEAYDRYAASLYSYCRTLLHEPADVADAVQDTFVIAASKLASLRDPERLRPWLYAVARNECFRRIRGREAPLDEAQEMTDESAEVSTDAERRELRTLVRAALLGLNPSEQEILELQLRQGLDGGEAADVLGMSRNHAHALLSRARDQLETSLGALLVARSGRRDCAALSGLLEDWDGRLTVLLRKRLNRHIEHCPVCSDRKRRELAPAMFLGITPIAALPLAASAIPAGLRAQVLRLALSDAADAVAHRAAVAQRTPAFGSHGFPRQPLPPKPRWYRATHGQAAAAGSAVAAGGLALAVLLAVGTSHGGLPIAGVNPGPTASGTASGSPAPPGPHRPATGKKEHAQATGTPTAAAYPGPRGSGIPEPTTSTTGPAGPTPPATTTSPPASTPPVTPPPTTSTPPPPPQAGTLVVSPSTLLLTPLLGGSIRLTAEGGPVSWSVSMPFSLLGEVTASPSSGTLAAGQSTTVRVNASLVSLDSDLTVSPGDHTVAVLIGLGLIDRLP